MDTFIDQEIHLKPTLSRGGYLLEVGRLFYERINFQQAEALLLEAKEHLLKDEDYSAYLKACHQLMRIYAEWDAREKLENLTHEIFDLLAFEKVKNAELVYFYYVLGVCFSLKKETTEKAFNYFELSITKALEEDRKDLLLYPVLGKGILLYACGDHVNSERNLEQALIMSRELKMTDLQISALISQGQLKRDQQQFDEALKCLWNAYELLKVYPSLLLHAHVLYALGSTLLAQGQTQQAQVYLDLVSKVLPENQIPRLARALQKQIHKCEDEKNFHLEFTLDLSQGQFKSSTGVVVDFKGQRILLDLLHLLMKSPGHAYKKDEIVQLLWKEIYNSTQHDNKLYVTMKRLKDKVNAPFAPLQLIVKKREGYAWVGDYNIHITGGGEA